MARRPRSGADPQDAIVDAALALAAERDWEEVRLGDIAARAGISLAQLRATFDSKQAILAAFSRRVDRAVLDGIDPEVAHEPPRERLFDILMARFDALGPHRAAIRSILSAMRRRPASTLASSLSAVRSMTWMLEGAGIDAAGPMGRLRTKGLAFAYGRALQVWLKDDDPGMARTMVALDRQLRDGEVWLRRADRLCGLVGGLARAAARRRRERPYDDEEGTAPQDSPRPQPGGGPA